jgi:hypothetical protein
VLPELLESLEQDQVKMPEVYDRLAIRYRQEPYRSSWLTFNSGWRIPTIAASVCMMATPPRKIW